MVWWQCYKKKSKGSSLTSQSHAALHNYFLLTYIARKIGSVLEVIQERKWLTLLAPISQNSQIGDWRLKG